MSVSLAEIRALQFTDLPQANERMLEFFRQHVPVPAERVEVRPLAVSLNSVNGFVYTADRGRLFFKAHVESQVAGREYYNTDVLTAAGYPVIRPLLKASESDSQHVLLYEVIETPTMFDACRAAELGESSNSSDLIAAQQLSDRQLLDIYRRSLAQQTAEENAQAPVHQLFWHRLTGGRYADFYGSGSLDFGGFPVPWGLFSHFTWRINGVSYPDSIATLVDRAQQLLDPAQAGPCVVGHGDAHNGNVFFRGPAEPLLYFDPAFAGRHSPLLDLVKPLYHNVFAQWMYFPQETAGWLETKGSFHEGEFWIEHNYKINPLRQAILDSKVELTLKPALQLLRDRGWLRDDWREYLRCALMCCPLLTMNLFDSAKFPLPVALLGFAHAVELGNRDLVE